MKVILLKCSISLQIGQEISRIASPDVDVAFAPSWSDETQDLYYVNYLSSGEGASIYRCSFEDGTFNSAFIEGFTSPAFIIPIRKKCKICKNLFVVGLDHNVAIIKWDGKSTRAQVVEILFSVETSDPLSRTNYARADSKGRLYFGTISKKFCDTNPQSSFYRYTADKGVQLMFSGTSTTSGIAINEKAEKLYHLDSCNLLVTEFDWDPATGDICNYTFSASSRMTIESFFCNLFRF